ncbi:MAG TPA: succinylglutamate desuccinylase/aspartoacylase family protein [Atribacterota bacterium]|nr:succinylglutamate desuccinylase/aspartoacylase family protein [Atribacterota bacterium]
MSNKWLRKTLIILLSVIMMVIAGREFLIWLNEKEPIVEGPGVTRVAKLSDYFADLKGTALDTNIYILEGEEDGGAVMVTAGVHTNELSGVMTNVILIENAHVEKGKVILIPFANNSAFTAGHPGEAYPMRYHIKTDWGSRWFRFGDRYTNPIHQWPDPEVYVHYPSGQSLSGFDIRNLNRTFPGKADGTITEKVGHAIMQVIEKENVDLFIDLHEAEPMYPVINTIVANQKAMDIAVIAEMNLSAFEGIKIGKEISPENLHGLTHREVGDHSRALSLLAETCDPIQDPLRGRTDEALIITGKDEFILKAAKLGLLYVPFDETGSHIDVRTGRHTSTVLEIISAFSELYPDKEIIVSDAPRYAEIIEKGVGYFLLKPRG